MEIVLELLSSIVGHAFSWLTGFVYMHVKYRSAKKRKQVLDEEFNGSYSTVGSDRTYRLFGWVWLVVVALFLLVVLWQPLKIFLIE